MQIDSPTRLESTNIETSPCLLVEINRPGSSGLMVIGHFQKQIPDPNSLKLQDCLKKNIRLQSDLKKSRVCADIRMPQASNSKRNHGARGRATWCELVQSAHRTTSSKKVFGEFGENDVAR
jgi:hypothetical protein